MIGDWGEVVTRYPYRKVGMDHLLSRRCSDLEFEQIIGQTRGHLASLLVPLLFSLQGCSSTWMFPENEIDEQDHRKIVESCSSEHEETIEPSSTFPSMQQRLHPQRVSNKKGLEQQSKVRGDERNLGSDSSEDGFTKKTCPLEGRARARTRRRGRVKLQRAHGGCLGIRRR